MKLMTGFAAALSAVVLLAGPSPAQTGDTMRLGVSSQSGSSAAFAAQIFTLQGRAEDRADTQDVIFRPYARGYFHGSQGYGYRPWVGYYRPFVRPYYFGYYRPWAGYYRPWVGFYPSIAFSSYGYSYPIGSAAVAYAADPCAQVYASPGYSQPSYAPQQSAPPPYALPANAPMTTTAETLPVPRPGGTYRYDGGPVVPVPMPDGSRPLPMTQPSMSGGIAVATRVSAPPAKTKITYPAYGEELPPPRVSTGNSIVVKKPGSK